MTHLIKFRELVEQKDTVVFTFGRFNPPTTGHEKLIQKVKSVAGSQPFRIYPSFSQNQKKDPLPHALKIAYMRKMFSRFAKNIVADKNSRTAIDIAVKLYDEGFKNLTMVVGSDRVKEFQRLLSTYNGVGGKRHGYYKFDSIDVVSAGERDPDAEGVEGMSASKMRKAVMDDDFEAFKKGTPKGINDGETRSLYDAVRAGMGVKKKKEVAEVWEIAPRYDQRKLRENYIKKKVFRMGDIVESLSTGLIGKIIRRGTNYLISVSESNVMFKSWIHDVMEYTETKMERRMRDKTHPNYLVGTGGYRKNVMAKMGVKKIKNFNVEQFINKYKLRK